MHLDNLINHINLAATGIELRNPDDLSVAGADATTIIHALVSPVVDCYPGQIKENATFPASVYEPVGVEWFGDEDYKLFKTDKMVVTIKADTLSELIALIDGIEAQVLVQQAANVLTAIEIVDIALGYEADRGKRIGALEIDITTFNGASQTLPAAYIYQSSQQASELSVNGNRQTHTHKFELMVVAPSSQIAAKRETLRSTLVGYQPESWPVEYVQGQRLATLGAYAVWRDSYQYQQVIS